MFSRQYQKALLGAITLAWLASPSWAKSPKSMVETIEIDASPESVFETIQSYRTCEFHHRRLVSYDGKTALIEENLEALPVYGNVHCLWLEKEVPYQRIDYKLVESDKFASGSGSYVILPPKEQGMVTLELDSELESGSHLPFAKEITQVGARKDMRARLQIIKKMAEMTRLTASR